MSTPITKLFVSQLPYSTDEGELRDFFVQAGWNVVDVRVIFDRATGLSKGFGFVELDTPENAQRARDQMNGATLKDRRLIVDFARPAGSGGPSGGGPRPHRSGEGGPGPRREYEPRRDDGPRGGFDRGPRAGGFDRGPGSFDRGPGGPPRAGGFDRGPGGPPRGGFDRGPGPRIGPPRGFVGGMDEPSGFGTKGEFGGSRRSHEPRKRKYEHGRGDDFGGRGGRRHRDLDDDFDPRRYQDELDDFDE